MIRDEDHVETKEFRARSGIADRGLGPDWPSRLPVRDSELAAGTLELMEPLPD
jgi:hypothetical protein